MPPKPNRSPFGLFMYAYEYEQRKSIPIQQLVTIANPLWQAMTEEQKLPYEQLSQRIRHEYDTRCDKQLIVREIIGSGLVTDNRHRSHSYRAKTTNITVREDNEEDWDRKTTTSSSGGASTAVKRNANSNKTSDGSHLLNFQSTASSKRNVGEDFDDESDYEVSDEQAVDDAIANLSIDQKNMNIIIISFNVVVMTMEGQFYPNEIGLTMMSVAEGVKDKYHKLIYGKVPDGYYGRAKQHADSTHKIALNDDGYEKDYLAVVREIHTFISRSDLSAQTDSKNQTTKKLIFCSPANKSGIDPNPQIVGCLKWLAEAVQSMRQTSINDMNTESPNDYDFNGYRVLDLSLLLYAMSKPFETFHPRSVFIDDLLKAIYDFSSNTSCEFHEQTENRFCALGATVKLAYLFLEPACRYLEVAPTENHFPLKQSEDVYSESFELKFRPVVKNSRRDREQTFSELQAALSRNTANTVRQPSRVNHYYIGIGRSRNNPR